MFAMHKPGGDGYLSHRRRAAVATLAPHLSEDSLKDALMLLEKEFTAPGVPCLIAYVDAIGSRHGIGKIERKRLYTEFYRFLNAVDERDLPADPWRPVASGPANASAALHRLQDRPEAQVTGFSNEASVLEKDAADAVYGRLISLIHAGVSERSAEEQESFWNTLDASVEMISALGAARSLLRRWLRNADAVPLEVKLTTEQMSAVVHAIYIALCVAMERVDADALFDAVVEKVRQMPEASEFQPEGLLWTGYVAGAAA